MHPRVNVLLIDPTANKAAKLVILRQILFGPDAVPLVHAAAPEKEICRDQSIPGIANEAKLEVTAKLSRICSLVLEIGKMSGPLPEQHIDHAAPGRLRYMDEDAAETIRIACVNAAATQVGETLAPPQWNMN